MVFNNSRGENKLFIGDELASNNEFIISMRKINNSGIIIFERKDGELFNMALFKENILIPEIRSLLYNQNDDMLIATIDENYDNSVFAKQIDRLELCGINLSQDSLVIATDKIPMFKFEKDNNTYPKFDMNISNCLYELKIYINSDSYLLVPYVQTHNDIISTLDHIKRLTFFLSQTNPEFIIDLINNTAFRSLCKLTTVEDGEMVQKEEIITAKYIIHEEGIYLITKDEQQIVNLNTFFTLVMDGTWDIEFIDESEVEIDDAEYSEGSEYIQPMLIDDYEVEGIREDENEDGFEEDINIEE